MLVLLLLLMMMWGMAIGTGCNAQSRPRLLVCRGERQGVGRDNRTGVASTATTTTSRNCCIYPVGTWRKAASLRLTRSWEQPLLKLLPLLCYSRWRWHWLLGSMAGMRVSHM